MLYIILVFSFILALMLFIIWKQRLALRQARKPPPNPLNDYLDRFKKEVLDKDPYELANHHFALLNIIGDALEHIEKDWHSERGDEYDPLDNSDHGKRIKAFRTIGSILRIISSHYRHRVAWPQHNYLTVTKDSPYLAYYYKEQPEIMSQLDGLRYYDLVSIASLMITSYYRMEWAVEAVRRN